MFSKNAAKNHLGSGGAIRFEGSGITCRIANGSSFISNVAELDGGAIHLSDGLAMNITDVFFLGNEVRQGAGAAIYAVVGFHYSPVRCLDISCSLPFKAVKLERSCCCE